MTALVFAGVGHFAFEDFEPIRIEVVGGMDERARAVRRQATTMLKRPCTWLSTSV